MSLDQEAKQASALTSNLLEEAKREILNQRQRIEVLQGQVDMATLFATALGVVRPPKQGMGQDIDVCYKLHVAINELKLEGK